MPTTQAPTWPPGTVEALLDTDLVTPPTRAALRQRLQHRPGPSVFFTTEQCATLAAVCAHLIPQPDPERRIDLAGRIDARLAAGDGDGWRYDALPPDGEAHRRGLEALDASAQTLGGAVFAALDEAAQDWLLGLAQRGELGGPDWDGLPCGRWFEELLAEATELYYAHPWAQSSIGYVGMADAQGWSAIGLDQLEFHEPLAAFPAEARRRG